MSQSQTPAAPPSPAAMRAAKQIADAFDEVWLDDKTPTDEAIAAIIDREMAIAAEAQP